MNSFFYINLSWIYFCITFGVMLLIRFLMSLQSKNLYSLHVFVKKFSVLDLQSPSSPLELATYISGIFKLPPDLSKISSHALKENIYLGFLFIPLAYGSIFLFCMKISVKLTSFGHSFFAILAWIQIIPLICAIIEYIYLLQKIQPVADVSKRSVHMACQVIEITKWAITLIAIVFGISAMVYFWLTGRFNYNSIQYLLIILAEIIIILFLKKLTVKSGKVDINQYRNIVD